MKVKGAGGGVYVAGTQMFPSSGAIQNPIIPFPKGHAIDGISTGELPGPVYIVQIFWIINTGTWVYGYGPYSSLDAAQAVVDKLKRILENQGAWLTGGELFNYGVRSACINKTPE